LQKNCERRTRSDVSVEVLDDRYVKHMDMVWDGAPLLDRNVVNPQSRNETSKFDNWNDLT